MTDSLTALRRLSKLTASIIYGPSLAKHSLSLYERSVWQQEQSLRMLDALETEVTISGNIPQEGLLVSNHLSYLDAIVIASQAPMVFVAKSEVLHWPLIGRILKTAGTILADRTRRASATETSSEILKAMEGGLPVVFFPEGTSSNGSHVLPFKPALLQIALNTKKPITPAAIRYEISNGNLAHDVCYWGDHSFASHIVRLARIRKLSAHLQISAPPVLPDHRKDAAQILHAEVSNIYHSMRERPIH